MKGEMDLEERKRQLAELKAAREAKQRQMERLAQSTASTAAAAGGAVATAAHSSTVAAAAASSPVRQDPPAPSSNITVVSNVGAVEVAPIETASRHTDTDPVFVYEDEREHPDVILEKCKRIEELEAEVQQLKAEQQQLAQQSDNNGAATGRGLVILQRRGFTFADKSATNTSLNTVRTPSFIEFVSKGVSALEGITKGAHPGLPLDETVISSSSLSASANGAGTASQHANELQASGGAAVRLFRRCALRDGATCKDRVVAALSFTNSPDIILVALSAAEGGTNSGTAQGLVLLWNIRRPHQPPLRFVCQDEIKVITYSPFHEHLIIGGTATGRIVCWNSLSGEAPVVMSFPSLDAHRSAILSAVVRGDANSNQLVTVCRDGRVCTWQPEKPRSPLTSLAPPPNDHTSGGIMCAASFACTSNAEVVDGGASRLVAGTVGGHIYSTVSKNTRGAIDLRCQSERRHENAVACAACHPYHPDPRVTELVLTSSADPACFLWFGSACVVLDAFTDNVYDVSWCPVHPSLFAAADGAGRVTLWNITSSLLAPVCSAAAHSGGSANGNGDVLSSPSASPSALKVQWDRHGERLLCGTSNGDVCLFDVANTASSAEASGRSLSEWVSKTFAAEASS